MDIKFFTTHCPKCAILKKKLDAKNLPYTEMEDVDEMVKLGLKSAPALQIDNEKIMNFSESIAWINNYQGA